VIHWCSSLVLAPAALELVADERVMNVFFL
jgi:hypothetical protein